MRSPEQLLDDILDACDDAALLAQQGRDVFDTDPLLQRAAKNIVSEIGEAAKNVPDEILEQIDYPHWRQLEGMRDRVIHAYPVVDLDLLWDALANHVPRIAHAIRVYRAEADNGKP